MGELETLKKEVNNLQNALEQAQQQRDALYVVHEMAGSLTSELHLDPLLHKIMAAAVEVMNASAGSLLLLDEMTDELLFAVVEGGGGSDLKGTRMARDKGIAGWVATQRQPLIVDDVHSDDRYYQSIANTFDFKPTSLLCVPMISHNRLIGVLQVLHSAPGRYFGELEQQLLTTFSHQAAIAIENARLYESLKEEHDRLIVVEHEIRKRLARDLHDGPTQLLASIVMTLDFAKGLITKAPEYLPDELDQTTNLAKKALKQLRTLLFDLRPVVLETQGLIPALEVYSQRLCESEGLNINLQLQEEPARLSARAEEAIFAVVQEAVNNARKYAEASRIDLIIEPEESQDTLTVTIQDDGLGFDMSAVMNHYEERGSLGMINMKERTEGINGTFRLHSQPERGTVISLIVPLAENLATDNRKNIRG